MKRLKTVFKNLSWLLLEEVNPRRQIDFVEYELTYYESIFITHSFPMSIREAIDCVDLVVLHEREDNYYAYWPRLAELYRACSQFLRENTAHFENPIFGQGRFEESRIRARRDFKQRILRAEAERQGFVVV